MKKLFIISLLLCSGICKGQSLNDSLSTYYVGSVSSSIILNDSCWWTKKVDTILTDFVVIVDENSFVKKQRADFIIHQYEVKECNYNVLSRWMQNTRNEVYLLNGGPVEVLMYRRKGDYNNLVLGNSQ